MNCLDFFAYIVLAFPPGLFDMRFSLELA